LDAGLKDAGYSAMERRTSEAALDETFARIGTALTGKETLTRDLADIAARELAFEPSLSSTNSEEISRLAQSIASSLSDIAALVGKARELFDTYRKSTPSFLDDFLAPEGIITKKRSLDVNIRSAKDGIERARDRITLLRKDNAELGIKITDYRSTLENLRVSRARIVTQAGAAEEHARLIRRELSGQEALLRTVRDEIFFDRRRFDEMDERVTDTEMELAAIERKGLQFTAELEQLEMDIKQQSGEVSGAQDTIKKKNTDLTKVQVSIEKIHLELVQSETEIKNTADNFRETHSRNLMEFSDRIGSITETTPILREKLAGARANLKNLGSVNLMAPEEFTETKERFDSLSNQLSDLTKARDDLEKIAAEIRAESSAIFVATYNKIKKNFHNMFRRLFGGGKAELRLQDPNHVLESGIEIFAQPPGKKLENISLLSGGEKSMTAVALLFATYMVKPSPFCLLDEIDAALDEANVSRFVLVLREFGSGSQFVVITHNKKTMVSAGTLLGVSMEESGITKVISVHLENKTEETAPIPPIVWEEEDVEVETGRELPQGIDDASLISETDLRPVRGK
jgi:chromosome segregation protein